MPTKQAVTAKARKHAHHKVSNARLVVLDDDGMSIGSATVADLNACIQRRPIRGNKHNDIGIRFDDGENDIAVNLTPDEVVALFA